ncbi:MAG: hypothetical protein RLZZ169_343 [Pseudomonadota bacterium]|jgi:membrane-bound lytic murein transglycosylase D
MREAKWLLRAWFATCFWFVAAAVQADDADFPLPATLEPAVGFWIKVYTQASTEEGFLHDDENLSIIYEKLPRDRDVIDERRKQIAADLQVLGTGKRSDLSDAQQSLLELWGSDTSAATFKLAAQRVRWQLGQSDRYLEGLQRSGAYTPHIRAAARSLGVPEALAVLPHVESSFHPGATSSVAATGMFQFMRETAKRFMRVDAVVDERLDPFKAADAAMRLLKENHEELGTWPLALTAYNHGTNGMLRAVRESGTRDIGEIVANYKGPRFGFASRNFYAQFLAARQVEEDAERYFGTVTLQKAPDFAEHTLSGYVEADVIARALGVSVDTLRRDNPALLAPIWSGGKRIPEGYVVRVDRLDFAGDMAASVSTIAASDFHAAQVPDLTYTVQKGDSLSRIAASYRISVAELVAINQLRNRNAIRVGQKLVLPQANGQVPTLVVNSRETPVQPAADGFYTVRRGDTLSAIATRFATSASALMALNGLRDANALAQGQRLRLVAEAAAVASTDTAASVQGTASTPATESSQSAAAPVASVVAEAAVGSGAAAGLAVAEDGSIEVLPDETLGHYATWAGVSSEALMALNKLRSAKSMRVGMRMTMDFSKVDPTTFASRRQQFHSELQASYFSRWRVEETTAYEVQRSDSLMSLSNRNAVPLWLFRQYNPDIDASRLKPGQVLVLPKVARVNTGAP